MAAWLNVNNGKTATSDIVHVEANTSPPILYDAPPEPPIKPGDGRSWHVASGTYRVKVRYADGTVREKDVTATLMPESEFENGPV